jgi:hypothetical protein
MLFLLLLAGVALAAQEKTRKCVRPDLIDLEEEYYIKVGEKGTTFSITDKKQKGQYLTFTEPETGSSVPVKLTKEWKETTTKFKIERPDAANTSKIVIMPSEATDYALSMYKIPKEKRSQPGKKLKEKDYELSFQLREKNKADQEEIFVYNLPIENQEDPEDFILKYEGNAYGYKSGRYYGRYYKEEWNYPRKPVKMKNSKNQAGLFTEGPDLIDTQLCFLESGGIWEVWNSVKGDTEVYVKKLKETFPELDIDWTKMNSKKAYKILQKQGEKQLQSLIFKKITDAPDKLAKAFHKYWFPEPKQEKSTEKDFPNLKLYEKLNWKEQKKANKYIELQKENEDYELTDKEKKELPDVVKEDILETFFKKEPKGQRKQSTETPSSSRTETPENKADKEDSGTKEPENKLNHNAGKNLEMSVVGKNSAALKCTFLAFLACLIIQY